MSYIVFFSNNMMTEGALIALKEQGLSVPGDMSIISFGNISVPKLYNVKLTYVNEKIPVELIKGDSVKPLK